MGVLYFSLCHFLAFTHLLVRWRSRCAEAALDKEKLAFSDIAKAAPTDTEAKLSNQCALLSCHQRRELAAEKALKWQSRSERMAALRNITTCWAGRGIGYVLGVFDMVCPIFLIDRYIGATPAEVIEFASYYLKF